ncbi:hypothetical protein TNCV_292471 [Trichonephila clavipes]|nr:hypothetical protein TNCV_292471 [Trichonephila clavipes]
MELEGREIFSSSLHPWFLLRPQPQDRPTDFTSTYLVCTSEGIWWHRTQAFGLESDALTTRLPTAKHRLRCQNTCIEIALQKLSEAMERQIAQ